MVTQETLVKATRDNTYFLIICQHFSKIRVASVVLVWEGKKKNQNWQIFWRLFRQSFICSECAHQNSDVGILMCNMMVLGAEVFGRWLGYESWALVNRINILINEDWKSSLAPSATWGYNLKSATWQALVWQFLTCWSWTSSLQNCEK